MSLATVCERLTKLATPLVAVALRVPCKLPLPVARAAVTTVLSVTPLATLRRLPNWSRTWRTGCCANATPAVAVDEGCVRMARVLAAPATSRRVPKLEAGATPVMLAVPLRARLPLASGVPAVGRTRTFCQVNLQVTPLKLGLVTVKTNWVLVTELMATAVPLETPLMLLPALPEPVTRVINMLGAVPAVSKTKPAGDAGVGE